MHLETRVMVTGGAGFLGSHLCARLLGDGADIICLDDFFTGALQNIDHLLDQKRFEFVRHDVTFPFDVKVDQIANLACPASPVHYQRDSVVGRLRPIRGLLPEIRQTSSCDFLTQ